MVKNLPAMQETQNQSLGGEDTLEKGITTSPVFLPGELHGQKSLVGYSPWGLKELDTTERLTHTLTTTFMPICLRMIHIPFVTKEWLDACALLSFFRFAIESKCCFCCQPNQSLPDLQRFQLPQNQASLSSSR